jgi:citrate/tricarballylate utilization protein
MLVAEASRQLRICNACRYCEGFCAVFPALERRSVLDGGDISQLANLCHDCRACFDACMYAPPHEFAINVPVALSAVRVRDYGDHVWPRRVPWALRGWRGVLLGLLASTATVVVTALLHSGWSGLFRQRHTAASPYDLIPYPALLVFVLVPTVFAVTVMTLAARGYWRAIGPVPVTGSVVMRAVGDAASLRYLRGGGAECHYPDDTRPSGGRRRMHHLVAYGFGLCVVSTISAGFMQDLLGIDPPYSWTSPPVLTGTVGGSALAIGCGGMLWFKTRSSPVTSFARMTVKDYGLAVALLFLSVSGLATLILRSTPAFGVAFLVHLAAIGVTFAATPYSKLVHIGYRFLSLVHDRAERAPAETRAD